MKHPMFGGDRRQIGADLPTEAEFDKMKKSKFLSLKAEDLQDPNWEVTAAISGPVKGSNLPEEISGYEKDRWNLSNHKDPSRFQKRKHQINWLAHEAMSQEAEMLDRAASSRLTKSQTSLK